MRIMCGIVAYLGPRPAPPILLEGLRRLEYRGYDSAGCALLEQGELVVCRRVGRVADLEQGLSESNLLHSQANQGIAHTRWATHGPPTEANAHPHTDDGGSREAHGIALVHNGIIENHAALRQLLTQRGHVFQGQSDTEILAHLVGELYEGDLETAVRSALHKVEGAFAIAVISVREPGVLVAARRGSPLLVGVGDKEFVVASDGAAIVSHTSQAFALEDDQLVRCEGTEFRTSTLDNDEVTPHLRELEYDLEQIELGGHPHFMHKEIYEQPEALERSLKGRIDLRRGEVVLGGLADHARQLVQARRVVLLGQGTALHAAMIGAQLIEHWCRIPAEAAYASEFRYRNPVVEEGTVVISVSQSGETADTLGGLREARQRGAFALGVVNVVGSTIARETDAGVHLRVGPEIGVASTKAFLGQVSVLTLIAAWMGRRRHLAPEVLQEVLVELEQMPTRISRVLTQEDRIREIASAVVDRENWLFLGRGLHWPVAMEGALKLKEISYIHAEGMPAAEMKHGPIALIDDGMPVVFVATPGAQYEKVLANIEEVRARGGRVIAIVEEGDTHAASLAEHVLQVPAASEPLQPLLTVVPLQLLAYHAAVLRGKDVDKPRNLAKSVTVE